MEQNTICKQRRCQTISDWFFDISNWPSDGFVWFSQHLTTKFVNVLETSKQRIRLCSVSYALLYFLTLRLYENLAPGSQSTTTNHTETKPLSHRSGSWKGPAHFCRVFCRPRNRTPVARVSLHIRKPKLQASIKNKI